MVPNTFPSYGINTGLKFQSEVCKIERGIEEITPLLALLLVFSL